MRRNIAANFSSIAAIASNLIDLSDCFADLIGSRFAIGQYTIDQ
jgi:hypothetical protein